MNFSLSKFIQVELKQYQIMKISYRMEILNSQNYCYEKLHTFFFPADHSSRQEKGETLGLIFNYDFLILWPPKMYFCLYILIYIFPFIFYLCKFYRYS